MAADAPITGARRRAPVNPADIVPAPNTFDPIIDKAQAISVAAEAIDALILGVEVMVENQRRMMREAGAGNFLCDNELWGGIATLLTMVRTHALDVGRDGEAIEKALMRAAAPAVA